MAKKQRRVGNFHSSEPINVPEKEDIKFIPFQGSSDVPPDPMANLTTTTSITNITSLPNAIAASISKLGVPEFIKRLGVMTEATKNDINSIARRETTRITKLTCPCCGKEFYKRFAHQRFCSGRCREENARRARTEFSAYEFDRRVTGERNVTINL